MASSKLASCFLSFDFISVRSAESAKLLKAITNDMLDFIFRLASLGCEKTYFGKRLMYTRAQVFLCIKAIELNTVSANETIDVSWKEINCRRMYTLGRLKKVITNFRSFGHCNSWEWISWMTFVNERSRYRLFYLFCFLFLILVFIWRGKFWIRCSQNW